ncbi:cilia- and flagella-associated protein 58-like isoform X2 [Apis dorsata]|uniref:cilia- and flagella-associated protein 58-like isoform X2 n=1 Tax=Apis dorsata TaxID=7462 RepID=UPI0012930754|nr:cilia- and flagella-associated protein 58-like isoform X2 [Apis dorsata]
MIKINFMSKGLIARLNLYLSFLLELRITKGFHGYQSTREISIIEDDASETSVSTSEGSSVSITFCNLEKQYAKILEEMKTNEALAPYMVEYTKLFEALYNAHKLEKELTEKIHSLKEENFMNTHNIFELNQTIRRRDDEIEMLKQNVIRVLKRADAAHTREQNAQDTIENLRLNVQQLSQEIAQKNRQLAAGEDTSIAKQKENLILEKERLISEVETLKERLKNMTLYTDELENRTSIATQKISELQENIDIHLSEISRERRGRLKAEEEVLQLQDELTVKKADLEVNNF